MKGKRNGTVSFISKWVQRVDQSYCNGSTVILCGGRSCTVYQCKKIISYSQTEICLLVGKRQFAILGNNLFCSSFSDKTVTVEGEITGTSWKCTDQVSV